MFCKLLVILSLASFCGCGSETRDETNKNGNEETVKNDSTAKPTLTSASQPVDEPTRVRVGALSFIPPKDWEKGKSSPSSVDFLPPNEPKWKRIALCPVMTGSKRANPGISFDRLKSELEGLTKKKESELNEGFRQHPDPLGPPAGELPKIERSVESSITIAEIGGTRVVEGIFYGVFKVDSKSLATKTTSVKFVTADGLYTFSLMCPVEAEKEMDQVWKSVEQTIRIKQ
jgi:hypothetical protein